MSGFLQKIAHSPHVNLGPRDIKSLQDLISTEKRAVDTTQRLSVERIKASNALRDWGNGEGEDLGDVLTKVSQLYEHLAQAEVAYAEHNANYRLKFKEIRTLEENLAALKRTRDSQASKIEAQDRKVSKMKEEHKDLPAAKQRLRELREEMVGLENSVLTEESRVGDFKRSATREALSLKLGALLELSEKTTIIAELGKLMVDELPTVPTEPGASRVYYDGYERTEYLLREAQRCLQGVTFNPAPISDAYDTGADGAGPPTSQFDDPAIRANDFGPEHPQTPSQQYGTADSSQTPYSTVSAHQGSAGSPYSSVPYQPPATNRYSYVGGRRTSDILPPQPLPHSGPQLQPLPDFQPLAVSPTPGDRPAVSSGLAPPISATPDVETASNVGGYASRTSGLAPPSQEGGWDPNRSSLAYMGEAPPSDDGARDEIEAREAQQAFEDEARAKEHEEEEASVPPPPPEQQQPWAYNTYNYDGLPSPAQEYSKVSVESTPPVGGEAAGGAGSPRNVEDDGRLGTISEAMLEASPAAVQTEAFASPPSGSKPDEPHRSIEYARPESPLPCGTKRSEQEFDIVNTSDTLQAPPVITGLSSTAGSQTSPAFTAGASPAGYRTAPASPAATSAASSSLPTAPSFTQPTSSLLYNPSSPSTTQPPSASAFEPRPLTPKTGGVARQAIPIRPQQGDTALGSKYGDIFVANRAGVDGGPFTPAGVSPGLRGVYGSGEPSGSSSGYFGASTTSLSNSTSGETGKRTISAGAFRRPAPTASFGTTGINVNGGRSFAPSGYSAGAVVDAGQAPSPGPSESELIADSWRSSAIPPAPQQTEQYTEPLETPNFDTSPLRLNKNRGSTFGVGRVGTLPAHLNGSSAAPTSPVGAVPSSPPQGIPTAFESAADGSGVSQVPPSYHSHAPPPVAAGPTIPSSPSSREGFSSNRFVTRLD
ncbi:hypothetical protein JCM1841_006826 [Sporobolomyces salmonicolor]